jgi:hypothetical protein
MACIVDKLKAFFRKPIVMFIEGILIVAMTIILGLTGINADGIQKIGVIAIALTGAVDSVATLIASVFDKQSKLTGE